jgi:lipopolysaccharide export system protein LptA
MSFELARFNVPNLAVIVAMALVPLIALPMHRHQTGTAKTQPIQVEAAEQAAPANVAYAIFD